jgi:hypothetical protein
MALKDTLVSVYKSPAVRKAAVALVLAILAALGINLTTGCASLTPAQARALESHECYVEALEPKLGPLAEDALAAIFAGGNVAMVLRAHALSVEDAASTLTRFQACLDEATGDKPAEATPVSYQQL